MVLCRPDSDFVIAPLDDSALALRTVVLDAGLTETIAEPELDSLLFVSASSGVLSAGGELLDAPDSERSSHTRW